MSELVDGDLYDPFALLFIANVAGSLYALPTGLFHDADGLIGVGLLIREVRDDDIRAFTSVGEGYRTPDAGVAAGDDGSLASEFAGASVSIVAVVGIWVHRCFVAGVLLYLRLLGILRLRVFRPRIDVCVLLFGHSKFLSVRCGLLIPTWRRWILTFLYTFRSIEDV
jgi:hypothetical protein